MLRIISTNTISLGCRFLSVLTGYEKPTITLDNSLVTDEENIVEDECISFYEKYKSTNFEKVKESEIYNIVKNARNPLNNKDNSFVLLGSDAIQKAIKQKARMMSLFFFKRESLEEITFTKLSSDVQIKHSNSNYLRNPEITTPKFKSPAFPIAIFQRPTVNISAQVPLTLILDNVTEPNNMSNILATAVNFRISRILLTSGCVNIYNSKVLDDTITSLVHTPIFNKLSWDTISQSIPPQCPVFYADTCNNTVNRSDACPYYRPNLINFTNNKSYALVIGGETKGVSQEARDLSTMSKGTRVVIPLVEQVNSLNSSVAAAILLSEFKRIYFGGK